MTATVLIKALEQELRETMSRTSVTGRLACLAATHLLGDEPEMAGATLHHYHASKAAQAAVERNPRRTAPPTREMVAIDPDTSLIWGWGEDIGRCTADAGWAVTEAGKPELMSRLVYKRAAAGLGRVLEAVGPEHLPWRLNASGEVAYAPDDVAVMLDDGVTIPEAPRLDVSAIIEVPLGVDPTEYMARYRASRDAPPASALASSDGWMA